MNRRRFGSAIVRLDPHMDLGRRRLGIRNFDIPIAVFVKDAGVEEIKGRIAAAPAAVLSDEPFVRIRGLGVLIEIAQPAVARSSVEIKIIFLDVLAVIALIAGEAKGALFEDWVAAVP